MAVLYILFTYRVENNVDPDQLLFLSLCTIWLYNVEKECGHCAYKVDTVSDMRNTMEP